VKKILLYNKIGISRSLIVAVAIARAFKDEQFQKKPFIACSSMEDYKDGANI
jgi:hypothetical protein